MARCDNQALQLFGEGFIIVHMKNYQRGVLALAALIVGTLAIIGLGSWWFMKTSGNTMATDPKVDQQAAQAAAVIVGANASSSAPAATASAPQTLEGGLVIQDIALGAGAEAKAGQTLAMHYTGSLDDGTVFDSSIPRGEPLTFTLGAGQVIKGWDQGIVGMKVGGKRKITIPPALGYGSRDMGAIPPNSTLHFDVELVAIQ